MQGREKKLLIGFLAAFTILGGGLGIKTTLEIYENAQAERQDAERRLASYERTLRQADTWEARLKFLGSDQPRLSSESKAQAEILETLETSVAEAGLVFLGRNPRPTITEQDFVEVRAWAKVQGTIDQLVPWLYELQSADGKGLPFRAVPELTVQADKRDPSKLTCEILLTRRYVPGEGGAKE